MQYVWQFGESYRYRVPYCYQEISNSEYYVLIN
jgi:hypothetical protein